MIYTSSIIDGFKVILGALPIQFAMLVTMLTCVHVKSLEDKMATFTYFFVVFTHIVMIIVSLMYHFFFTGRHMLAAQLNIFAMIL